MSAFEVQRGAIQLVPLRRVSPSRLHAFRECPLREIFSASRATRLLPRAAAARFGTAVHRLLAAAAHLREPEFSALRASRMLESYIAEEETKMEASPADQMLLPLSDHLRDYEVRKRRAIASALVLSRTAGSRREQISKQPGMRRLGTEVWVATDDGLIGGYVDEVAQTDRGIVLRDYKTGLAATPGTAAEAAAWEQLKLYAAVYADATGQWPVALEIVPLDDGVHAQAVLRDECSALAIEARELAREYNGVVASHAVRVAAMRLARPAPDTCRRCEYRPLCPAYRQLSTSAEENLPNDLFGRIRARHSLGNGRLLFEFSDDAQESTLVRGITNDAERYPALPLLQIGRDAAFFNLAGNRASRTFSETQTTVAVIYAA